MEVIETPRLRLEPLAVSHAAALFAGLQQPDIYRFIDELPPVSVAALEERYRRLSGGLSPDGRDRWLNWALWWREAGEYAGYVQATVHADRTAEIAYVLFPDKQGRGLAREAVTAMIAHLREHDDVTTLLARVDPRNKRSTALLIALKFERAPDPADSSDHLYQLTA